MIPYAYLDSSVVLRLLWREQSGAELALATHDAAMGRAARASGFSVIGL